MIKNQKRRKTKNKALLNRAFCYVYCCHQIISECHRIFIAQVKRGRDKKVVKNGTENGTENDTENDVERTKYRHRIFFEFPSYYLCSPPNLINSHIHFYHIFSFFCSSSRKSPLVFLMFIFFVCLCIFRFFQMMDGDFYVFFLLLFFIFS